jgi:phosphohistidine phosphatase
MLTLSLLRHAKSGWDDPGLEDLARPLAARGRKAAPLVGAFMAANGIAPDMVICSPSVRTRETLSLIGEHLTGKHKTIFEDALYLASSKTLLARVQAVKGRGRAAIPKHVLIIGHNPGLQEFALALMTRQPEHAGDRRALSAKLPTSGLVVLDFDAERWRDVMPGDGRLRHFVTPKRLQAA